MEELPILFEDESLLILDKPPGIVVNRAPSVKVETVQDFTQKKIHVLDTTSKDSDFFVRSGIVHRIDKETSGILVVAKTEEAFIAMQNAFKERSVKKTYCAIVHGIMVPREGEIHAPVGRMTWNREHFGIVPGGKDAVTRYTVQGNWFLSHGEKFSFVLLYPQTGRTHQIRVHLKYLNHPILGDYLYAGRKTARDDRLWAPRVMLHAKEISFTHPKTGAILTIHAPMPRDMMEIVPINIV
ncbi:RluA family pseudouridine synthase [Candidatus Gottesmanbacteria bacterium]|nr:RluA family pseudouridine synthase [Candidatus Gottesmanbacteria bacterium]